MEEIKQLLVMSARIEERVEHLRNEVRQLNDLRERVARLETSANGWKKILAIVYQVSVAAGLSYLLWKLGLPVLHE